MTIFDKFRQGKKREFTIGEPARDGYLEELILRRPILDISFSIPTPREAKVLSKHPFSLGRIGFHGETLTINPYALNRNFSIVAGTRTGKTTCIYHIILHLAEHEDIGIIIYDFKRDYTRLVHEGFKVIDASKLPWNVLEYFETTNLESHCLAIADLLADTFHLKDTRNLFYRILLKLLREMGQPTLQEFRRELENAKSGKGTGVPYDQLMKAQARINFLCDVLGETSHVRHGIAPHKHALDRISITLNLGSDQAHALLVAFVNNTLINYNMKKQIRPDRARTVFVTDESSYVFEPNHQFPNPVLRFLPINGEMGLGYILATQGRIDEKANANIAHKLLLGTDDATVADIQLTSMGADHRQKIEGKLLLGDPGNAIGKIPGHPHLILVALKPPEHHNIPLPTEHDIEQSTADLTREIREYTPKNTPAEIRHQPKEKQMMPGVIKLLRYAAEHPASSATECYTGAGLGIGAGDDALKFLTDHEMVNAEQVKMYRGRGRQPLLIEVTRTGTAYLRKHHSDIKTNTLAGRGSLKHRAHAELVARHYAAQGLIIRKEIHDTDLGVEDPATGKWFAVEIVTANESNLEHRIAQNTKAGAQRTLIICSDTTAVKRVKKRVGTTAEVTDLREFLLERGEPLQQRRDA